MLSVYWSQDWNCFIASSDSSPLITCGITEGEALEKLKEALSGDADSYSKPY